MRASKAKALIAKQRAAISGLYERVCDWAALNSWQLETRIIINRLFGTGTPHVESFDGIRYNAVAICIGGGQDCGQDKRYWCEGLDQADAFLKVLEDEIDRDTSFGWLHPQKATGTMGEDGKITLYWLWKHMPARFVGIGVGALLSAFFFGLKMGQVSWIKELFK